MTETIHQPWLQASREHPSVRLGQKRRRGGHVEQERITCDGNSIKREWRLCETAPITSNAEHAHG